MFGHAALNFGEDGANFVGAALPPLPVSCQTGRWFSAECLWVGRTLMKAGNIGGPAHGVGKLDRIFHLTAVEWIDHRRQETKERDLAATARRFGFAQRCEQHLGALDGILTRVR